MIIEKNAYVVKYREPYGWGISIKKPVRDCRYPGWEGSSLVEINFGKSYKKHLPENIQNMKYEDEPKKVKITFDFDDN